MASEGQDLIEHLTSEHRQVEQMWAQLQEAHAAGAATQQDLGQEIVKALTQHDALELQLLYPALARAGEDEMAEHGKEEHTEIRRLLNEVDGKDPADEGVFSTFEQILLSVDAHVADEEENMFPRLRAGLSSDELIDLGKKSEQAEKVAPTHPHPTTPDGKVGATVVGGAAGLVDKARDALKGR
jgi:hemerythrin superfamily protein